MTDPKVTWAGVIVRLSDGRTVALEFEGAPKNFVTADVHTLKPWSGGRSATQDEVRVTIQGNGRVWTEGEQFAKRPNLELTDEQWDTISQIGSDEEDELGDTLRESRRRIAERRRNAIEGEVTG